MLNKALKWLSKKILEAREDPSLHFGDFAEHFLTLGVSSEELFFTSIAITAI